VTEINSFLGVQPQATNVAAGEFPNKPINGHLEACLFQAVFIIGPVDVDMIPLSKSLGPFFRGLKGSIFIGPFPF